MPSQTINEYSVVQKTGEGRYGICYQVSDGKKLYTLKQLRRGMLRKVGSKVGYEEEILKRLNHPGVPRFIKRLEFDHFYGYLLEYKEGKTFEDILYLEGRILDRKSIHLIGGQLISIIKYLHSQSIVHRDIRVPNTLYDGKQVFLVDFGLARWINNTKYKADIDFAYLGDFLLHLYYSGFQKQSRKKAPWYKELDLHKKEATFLKKLLGVEPRYENIHEVEADFCDLLSVCL